MRTTDTGSPARELLIDIWVKYADEKALELLGDGLPPQFLLAFASAMTREKRLIERDLGDVAGALMSYKDDYTTELVI